MARGILYGVLAAVVLWAAAGVSGEAPGPRLRVSAPAEENPSGAAVAAAGGSFVVAWRSGTASPRILARLFDLEGAPAGPASVVGTAAPGSPVGVAVAGAGNGAFAVVWSDPGRGLLGRWFDAGGAAGGGEFPVAPVAGRAGAALTPDGDLLVTWEDLTAVVAPGLFVRRFDGGGAPLGAPLAVDDPAVSSSPAGPGRAPRMAVGEDGTAVVVWQAAGEDGSDIFARRLDPLGVPTGGVIPAALFTPRDQRLPAVGRPAGGEGFVAAWESDPRRVGTDLVLCLDGSGSIDEDDYALELEGTAAAIEEVLPHDGSVRLTVIQFASQATVEVPPTVLDSPTLAAAVAAAVRGLTQPDFRTCVACCIEAAVAELDGLVPPAARRVLDLATDGLPNEPSEPRAAAFAAAEAARAAGFDALNAVGVDLTTGGRRFLESLVFPQPAGGEEGFVMEVEDFSGFAEVLERKVRREVFRLGSGVFARAFRATGGDAGPEFQVNSSVRGDQSAPDVAAGGEGLLVVWSDEERGAVSGQLLDVGGGLVEGEVDAASDAAGEPRHPRAAPLADGRFAVVWEEGEGGAEGAGVFAQIFAGIPEGLCRSDASTLCLGGGRFRVEARWRPPAGGPWRAGEVAQTSRDAGYVSFFNLANVEVLVAVEEVCATASPCHAISLVGLADFALEITVTDTASGLAATYRHAGGAPLPAIRDEVSFGAAGAVATARSGRRGPNAERGGATFLHVRASAAARNACGGDSAATLCLAHRFLVEAPGQALPLSPLAGAFSMDGGDGGGMAGVAVKILPRCRRNGHYWLALGGLSDAGLSVTITDTRSGARRVFQDPPGGHVAPIVDRRAFPCEP